MKKSSAMMSFWVLCLFLPSCTFVFGVNIDDDNALNLEPLWQTEAVFDNPDSVLFDPVAKILIVSNINGPAMKRDGNGYLSKVALNGVILDRTWLTGLDGPKGMALQDNTLYVADISTLAVIDLTSGLVEKYPAPRAKYLNDVTLDSNGRIFVSDTYTDTIYLFNGKELQVWLRDKRLASPNGLFAEGDALYVGSWGQRTCGLETEVPGHLLKIDLATQKIQDVGSGTPLANVDGVEGLGSRGFLVTDSARGLLIHLSAEAEIIKTIALAQGPAGLEVLPPDWELMVVPLTKSNTVKAFTLPLPR